MSGTEPSSRFEREVKANVTSTEDSRTWNVNWKLATQIYHSRQMNLMSLVSLWLGIRGVKVSFYTRSSHSWGEFNGKVSDATACAGYRQSSWHPTPALVWILSRLPRTKRQSSINPLPHRTAKNSLRAPPPLTQHLSLLHSVSLFPVCSILLLQPGNFCRHPLTWVPLPHHHDVGVSQPFSDWGRTTATFSGGGGISPWKNLRVPLLTGLIGGLSAIWFPPSSIYQQF